MAWQQLGDINLSYDWQFLAVPFGNYQLFRVSQLYNETDYIHGKIVIGQTFDEPKQFYNYRAIYPSRKQKIVRFVVPPELIKGSDSPQRYLAFKLDERYYRYSIGWRIQIEIQDILPTTLDELKVLSNLNRGELALIQSQLDRIESQVNASSNP